MAFFFGLVLSLAQAAPCTEDILMLFSSSQELFFIGKPEKSLNITKTIEEELHCTGLNSPSFLGELYLLKGASLYFLGQEQKAQAYLSSASTIITYNPIYGEELSIKYHSPALPILLDWRILEVHSIWIDGKPESPPFSTTASPHLVQLRTADSLLYSTFIYPTQDQMLQLPDFSPPPTTQTKYWWALPIGASLLTASGFMIAEQHKSTISTLSSREELDSHLQIQRKLHALKLVGLGTTLGSTLFVMVISSNSR